MIKRVSTTIGQNMVNPASQISILVSGDNVTLPSQRATSLALVANELLQNALEHGMTGLNRGQIELRLTQADEVMQFTVIDNGRGLPPGFDPEGNLGLGLEIVRTSVVEDMRGTFHIGPAVMGTAPTSGLRCPF